MTEILIFVSLFIGSGILKCIDVNIDGVVSQNLPLGRAT